MLCTLGALQLDDGGRPAARAAKALRALQAMLAKAPPPQSLACGPCFKAAIEVRPRGRRASRRCTAART